MVIVSNFADFPERWISSSGEQGRSLYAATAVEFLERRKEPDAVFLINCDPPLTYRLAAESLVPLRAFPSLVSVDIVLRPPTGLSQQLLLPLRRFLFSRIDHYIHYFRDLRKLKSVYGIGPDRSSFIPFKPNLSDHNRAEPCSDGAYVLAFGRSMRDFDTFLEAMEMLPQYPGAITPPALAQLPQHCGRFSRPLDQLPPNVRCLDYDLSEAAEIRVLRGAKIVVVPILKTSLVSAGISVCLNSLWLGKCVIGSEGPGMLDVFTGGEILTVPPEDPAALAAMIRRVWEDDELRRRTAAAGHAYALRIGGTKELYARIIDQVAAWWRTRAH
ncbi:MAG TPA: glycosyltransferase [Bryobacteraceae bacterium]|nr:glycosyltransferase [Bryobacteraceae bacterium]